VARWSPAASRRAGDELSEAVEVLAAGHGGTVAAVFVPFFAALPVRLRATLLPEGDDRLPKTLVEVL
jgi:hypothetical protein